MLDKKQKAWIVIGIASVIVLIGLILSGAIIMMIYPLLIALTLFLLGMFIKWVAEWCVKNIERFKIPQTAKKVEKKLHIKEGIEIVKESIDTVRDKNVNDTKSD